MRVPVGFLMILIFQAAAATGQTLQERLGYEPTARLLIIHADDLGMCHSINTGAFRALQEGNVNSASLMMTGPWLPEAVQFARDHAEGDHGIHLTLNSEWENLRWPALSPQDAVRGLLDPQGYFWKTMRDTAGRASVEEYERELRAQIDRALKLGLRPTHLDTHLGTIFERKDFLETALEIAKEYRIPLMVPDPTPVTLRRWGNRDYLTPDFVKRLKASGAPLLAGLYSSTEAGDEAAVLKEYKRILRNLPVGVSQIILHLGEESGELKAMTPSWRIQTSDFAFAMDPEVKSILEEAGVKRVQWKDIQRAWLNQ